VGIIAIFSLTVWFVTARKWFVGPIREIEEAEALGVDITQPGALEHAEEEMGMEKGRKA